MSLEETIEGAPVAAETALSIPTLELRGLQPAELARACREWGLFHVTGHGVPEPVIAAARGASRGFFARPAAEKQALARSRENPWGYNDRELTKTRRDRKEIFDIEWGGGAADPAAPFAGETPWPAEPAEFRPAMEAFAGACEGLAFELLGALADSLEVERARLADLYRPGHSSFLRLNYYPVRDALEPQLGPSGLGIHHHTDAGALTVLLQDAVSGLQVYRDGCWYEAAPVEGALTVNIGDLAQVWSNDRYPAPIHRVRAMTQADRYTAAFFFNPGYAAEIAPLVGGAPAYRPFRWGEFRAGRAEGDFANYGTEVQISDYRL